MRKEWRAGKERRGARVRGARRDAGNVSAGTQPAKRGGYAAHAASLYGAAMLDAAPSRPPRLLFVQPERADNHDTRELF